MITPLQLALLEALARCCERMFASQREWAAATVLPEGHSYRGGLQGAIRRIPPIWVTRRRVGRSNCCMLTARGLDLVDGRVAVWVPGSGPRPVRGAADPGSSTEVVEDGAPAGSPGQNPRMCLGQLLDWLEYVESVGPGEDVGHWARYRSEMATVEVELSGRMVGLLGDGSPLTGMVVKHASDRNDIQQFREVLVGLPVDDLGWAARKALSFLSSLDRIVALEELVLVAEARQLGLTEARERRREWRNEATMALRRRVVAALPESGGA